MKRCQKPFHSMTEPELKVFFNDLAKLIESILPVGPIEHNYKTPFVLVCGDDAKIAQYVSNCERKSAITWLRETANRIEQRQDVSRQRERERGLRPLFKRSA